MKTYSLWNSLGSGRDRLLSFTAARATAARATAGASVLGIKQYR